MERPGPQPPEHQPRRARLEIFFGFAPGVGKTHRMLEAARELVERKVDLVVGAVETHGGYDTGALTLGLELLPRRGGFDLDGALERRPQVLLLDELAHANPPGARHAKRWQDVLELLEAGVDVHTTLDVQSIESLNDVVAQVTGLRVTQTVPDSIFERADGLQLVDLAPEELLSRLKEGKVYLPEPLAPLASGLFQRGNLLALRELALRKTAERVNLEVLAWREQQGVTATWATSERILVCVGSAPASGRLIRAGRRMAAGLRAPWTVAWVDTMSARPVGEADRQRLEAHLRLAESLGAEVVRLTGSSVSGALLEFARKANVTRLLIGKPTHSRLRDRLRGSLLDDVVRGSGEIDVHVISGEELPTPPGAALGRERVPARAWLGAIALVAATTAVSLGIRALFPVPDLEMLYLGAVMLAAVRFGRGPSLLAAALSVAAYDFFFVLPHLTLQVADFRYVLTFAMMFGVGFVASELASRLRAQERLAVSREQRTRALFALSRALATSTTQEQTASLTANQVASSFDAAAVVLLATSSGGLEPTAAWPIGTQLEAAELKVAQWVAEHGRSAGLGTDTLPGTRAICAPLKTPAGAIGAISLLAANALTGEQRELLESLASQAALALERVRLAADAEAASLRARTEEMRSSLLSAVSHDLRTPLAAITGAATTLRDTSVRVPEPERAGLVDSICDEAERLERLVGNLLDMTKLESGGLTPRREWVPVDELVGSALTRLEAILAGRPVLPRISPDVPLLHVDPVLFEQVLINLLENAARYTPPGTPVQVDARVAAGQVFLEVLDRGPGLPAGAGDRIFEKFYRGPHAGIGGAGLGLAICKGIVEVHGGKIAAFDREGGGAGFRVTLPQPKEPPK